MFEHTVRAFDADLQELAQKIAAMGLLAKRQMADAIDALANCNIDTGGEFGGTGARRTRCVITTHGWVRFCASRADS
jgi:hypothetical protein